jgi:hypothetical protein
MLGILAEPPTSVGLVMHVLLVHRCSCMIMKCVHAYMDGRATALSFHPQRSNCELNGCHEYSIVGLGVEPNAACYQHVVPHPLPHRLRKGKSPIVPVVRYHPRAEYLDRWCFVSNVIHEFSAMRRGQPSYLQTICRVIEVPCYCVSDSLLLD